MAINKPTELKLIYVLKIGYNSKGEGLYEFIFSKEPQNIDYQEWGWDQVPASSNSNPPTKDYIDKVFSLKTDAFDLNCLHEANDRPYLHGYYTIHALAYEDDTDDEDELPLNAYEDIDFEDVIDGDNDDLPLLVFHYGMTLQQIEDILYERDIILRGDEFVHSKNISIVKK